MHEAQVPQASKPMPSAWTGDGQLRSWASATAARRLPTPSGPLQLAKGHGLLPAPAFLIVALTFLFLLLPLFVALLVVALLVAAENARPEALLLLRFLARV